MKSEQSMSQHQSNGFNNQTQVSGDNVNSQPHLYDQQLKNTSDTDSQLEKEKDAAQQVKNENTTEKEVEKKHAPHLDDELKIGNNTSWNSSKDNDANSELSELNKAGKAKKKHTSSYHEIESEETKNRRIKQQAEAGEAF